MMKSLIKKLLRESLTKEKSKLKDFDDIDWKQVHKNLVLNSGLNKDTSFDDMVYSNLVNGNAPSQDELNNFDHIWEKIPNLYDKKYKDYETFKNAVKAIWSKPYKANIL